MDVATRQHSTLAVKPLAKGGGAPLSVEVVETAIWLTEVAPKLGPRGAKFWVHLEGAYAQADPELLRLALKLATGAGKTIVGAMLIAWQMVNAVRHPNTKHW